MSDYTENPCERCGHSPDDHRPLSPTDPTAPFRCIVGSLPLFADYRPTCNCPDFVGEALTVEAVIPGVTYWCRHCGWAGTEPHFDQTAGGLTWCPRCPYMVVPVEAEENSSSVKQGGQG